MCGPLDHETPAERKAGLKASIKAAKADLKYLGNQVKEKAKFIAKLTKQLAGIK